MARVNPLILIPPVAFAAMAGLFAAGMFGGSGDDLPSAFIGRQAPALPEEGLAGQPLLTSEMLREGEVTVVNFWASWCAPCRAEHPVLMSLAEEGVRVAGFNFNDDAADARAFLDEGGDPFFAGVSDAGGRHYLEWGVTAPPETFIVDGDGVILARFAGPLIATMYDNRFRPALDAALAE